MKKEPDYTGTILLILALLIGGAGVVMGYSMGYTNALEKCIKSTKELTSECLDGMEGVANACEERGGEVSCQGQQERIWRWEECFTNENCRSCILMVYEDTGIPDVDWCHLHAFEEMQDPLPEYEAPPPLQRGPNL